MNETAEIVYLSTQVHLKGNLGARKQLIKKLKDLNEKIDAINKAEGRV